MKNLLLDGKILPFQDSGEPKVFYMGNWHELVDDQDGEPYFMYHGKANYLEQAMDTEPAFSDLLESFALCISLLAGLKMSEAMVNTPFGEKSVGSFIGNCEELHDKYTYQIKPTYIVASSHGPTLDDSVDNFSVFRGGDGHAYSDSLKEYKGLLKLEDTTLAVLARVIESTDY